jgi:hypothetical protein
VGTSDRLGALIARIRDIPLTPVTMLPDRLIRISRRESGEPYFGRSRGNRWDDPLRRYGVSYLGTTLHVAFAETILHDAIPERGEFVIPQDTLESRFAVTFKGEPLSLAPLYGSELKRLDGHNDLSAGNDYLLPRRWSRAVYQHPQNFDGLLYVSRHKNDGLAVALFERAKAKFLHADYQRLQRHPDFGAALRDFNVIAV